MNTEAQPEPIDERTPWAAPRLERIAADDTEGGIAPAVLEDSSGALAS